MFGFGKRSPKKSASLVPQKTERNEPPPPDTASLQRFDKSEHSDFSVLESVDGDGMVLIGKGTTVVGEVGNCSKVEIQGHLEGSIVADRVIIREGGSIKGGMHAGHAEVCGVVDGEVLVEELLDVRSTGRVIGEIAYGKLAVEVGGDIAGNIRQPQQAAQSAEPQHQGVNGYDSRSSLEAPSQGLANGQSPPAGWN